MFITNPLNESSLSFPVLEWVHLIGMVCGVGSAALMNFRLMGVGANSRPATVWRETWLLTAGGLMLAIFSGLLLLSIAPDEYMKNQAFRFKIGALVVALLFFYTMVRRAALRDRQASIIAMISLALFALVPLGGIFIGYL